jgi:hypothetical protein
VPDAGAVTYEFVVCGPAIGDGFVVVRADDIPRPRHDRLEFRGDGIWTECIEETRGEHWSFGLEAFGLRVDDPADDVGTRLPVGYDIEWATPDLVHGELLIGRDVRVAVDGRGPITTVR